MSITFPHVDEANFNPQRLIMQYVRYNKPFDIYMKIKEKVIAQDAAIRQASVLVYAYLNALANCDYVDYKYHFMIEAESGCGKSTFANALKAAVQIPVIICDASQITGAGWRGCDAADLLDNAELNKWGCGIIILDELDKAIMPQGGNAENHHRFVQESFLKMLDGGVVHNKDGVPFDCCRYLFIGMGAFTPMRERQAERVTIQPIGFGAIHKVAKTENADTITREHITEVCGSEQFMGRMVTVLHFQRLGLQHYKVMLNKAVDEVCHVYGRWNLPNGAEERILQQAMESSYGARNIRNQVWEYFMAEDSNIIQQMQRDEIATSKLAEGVLLNEEEKDRIYERLISSYNHKST